MIKQAKEGFYVIEEDKWISKWSQEMGRLDHDQYILPQVLKFIPEGGTVIDGGCFIGDHTIAYARKVGDSGNVYAFDPNKEAIECCRKNLAEHKNVNIYNLFLGSISNDAAFLDKNPENCGASKMLLNSDQEDLNLDALVQGCRIDDLLPLITRCDFIKLDIEGGEVFALEGARELIMMYRPLLLIEINRGALQSHGFDYATVFAAMDAYGYKMHNIPNCADTDPQYDILCTPNERT